MKAVRPAFVVEMEELPVVTSSVSVRPTRIDIPSPARGFDIVRRTQRREDGSDTGAEDFADTTSVFHKTAAGGSGSGRVDFIETKKNHAGCCGIAARCTSVKMTDSDMAGEKLG